MTWSSCKDITRDSKGDKGARPVQYYRVFGLNIASDLPLPSLVSGDAAAPTDVVIKRGVFDSGNTALEPGYNDTSPSPILFIPEVGRYLLHEGREIIIEAFPNVSDRNIALYLLGSAIGALLHQRGALPLHANVVEINGSAVAFIGPSGAGKSTLAAWFHDRGYRVLADDICVVDFVDDTAVVYPGIPRLRLWREALERSGRIATDHEMSFDDYEKYDVRTHASVALDPLVLRAIYGLSVGPGSQPRVTRVRGLQAIELLISNTYRGSFLTGPEQRRRHLNQCLEVATKVPIFTAARPWDLDLFEEVSCLLEAHAVQATEPDVVSAHSIHVGMAG